MPDQDKETKHTESLNGLADLLAESLKTGQHSGKPMTISELTKAHNLYSQVLKQLNLVQPKSINIHFVGAKGTEGRESPMSDNIEADETPAEPSEP